jgi:hypothetical protein
VLPSVDARPAEEARFHVVDREVHVFLIPEGRSQIPGRRNERAEIFMSHCEKPSITATTWHSSTAISLRV